MARLWDPWRELSLLEKQVNDVFHQAARAQNSGAWVPGLDAFQKDGTVVVHMELPGVRPEQVDVHIEDGTLVIRGERQADDIGEGGMWIRRERRFGGFERHIVLPEGTEYEAIEASFDLGVLELRIPEPKMKEPQRVAIKVGGGTPPVEAQSSAADAAPGGGPALRSQQLSSSG